LDVSAAVLIWLFGRLVFIPIAEGINFMGYPLPELLNFIILAALAIILLKILVDVRRFIRGLSRYAAVEIGSPYDITNEEIMHYRTAFTGIFYVIVVSFGYLLFVDYLSGIHPALAGVLLLLIVIWAIFTLWRVIHTISTEIRRYTKAWSEKILE
jgi:hypothetical protein